jgi:hypothetical protein
MVECASYSSSTAHNYGERLNNLFHWNVGSRNVTVFGLLFPVIDRSMWRTPLQPLPSCGRGLISWPAGRGN